MRIHWRPVSFSFDWSTCAHGLCVCRTGSGRPSERQIAFIAGFAWLHSGADATVQFDPRAFPPPGQATEALRAAIEHALRNHVLMGEIHPGYEVGANA